MTASLVINTTTFYWLAIIFLAVAFIANLLINLKNRNLIKEDKLDDRPWPLGINENMITDAERSFMGVLKIFTGDQFVICPKVCLRDVLFIQKSTDLKLRQSVQNRIDRKHLDFLLLDAKTFKPVYAIELDDMSHRSAAAQKRDLVKDKALNDAGMQVIRIPAQASYAFSDIEAALRKNLPAQEPHPVITEFSKDLPKTETSEQSTSPIKCPKCNIPMVLRKATKGTNAGASFYGCPNYPHCREIIPFDE